MTAVEFRYGEEEEELQQKKCMSMKKYINISMKKMGGIFLPFSGEVKSVLGGTRKRLNWRSMLAWGMP